MDKQEQQLWERFCRTGAIGDYLSYRAAGGGEASGIITAGGAQIADTDRRGGGAGETTGGA